jgi:hypothetical protein
VAQDFLGAFLIAPEIRLGGFGFDFGQFSALGFRVKETSATRRLARPGRRIFVSVLRSSVHPDLRPGRFGCA